MGKHSKIKSSELGLGHENSPGSGSPISKDREIPELTEGISNLDYNDPKDENRDDAPLSPQQKGLMSSFVKQLATSKGDLYTLSCPAFLISGTSLLEYVIHWMDYPDAFARIRFANDPQERMLEVVRWYISTLYGSYGYRSAEGRIEKKPYNPILGEQFFCKWEDENSDYKKVVLTAEQVSHHPPISGFYFESEALNMCVFGYSGQKTKFKGASIRVEQYGLCTVRIPTYQEEYEISLPELHMRGLLSGKIFVEITGNVHIKSNKNYEAELKFISKPWFGGQYHQFKGAIYRSEDGENSPIYSVGGDWHRDSYYKKEGIDKQDHLLFSFKEFNPPKKIVAPISEQNELESRRVWAESTQALERGDWTTASAKKAVIEDNQRMLRQERTEKKFTWTPKYFHRVINELDSSEARWVYNQALEIETDLTKYPK